VRQLPDHLPPGAVLDQERVFPADARTTGHVRHLDQQVFAIGPQHRHPTVHHPVLGTGFVRRYPQFVGVGVAAIEYAQQDVAKFPVIAEKLQYRLVACPRTADAQQVFRGRIQGLDEQARVNDDDTGIQAVDYEVGRRGFTAVALLAGQVIYFARTIVFC
jgi:hypothetical protein